MFKKNMTTESPMDIREEMRYKTINHEFFLLVRDQKYEEAYAVGMMYLKYNPQNNSIRQFCEFIQGNRQELCKMAEEQRDYTDGSSDQEEDQEDQQSDSQAQDQKSVISEASVASSVKSSASVKSLKSSTSSLKPANSVKTINGKQNTTICHYHKWDHKCKNESCPNKKKK